MLALLASKKLGRIVLGQKVRPIWTVEDDAEITNKRKLVPGHAASAAMSTSATIPASSDRYEPLTKEEISSLESRVEKVDSWDDDNESTLGLIMLKVIGNLKTSTFTEASVAWNHFKTLYRTPGLAGVYINFQKIIHWKMNDKANPLKQIGELQVLLDRLSKNNRDLPQKFQTMP